MLQVLGREYSFTSYIRARENAASIKASMIGQANVRHPMSPGTIFSPVRLDRACKHETIEAEPNMVRVTKHHRCQRLWYVRINHPTGVSSV